MESLLPLIIQLLSGAVGGNIVGKLFSNLSLGAVGNSIAGILGGGIGGQILSGLAGGGLDGIIGTTLRGRGACSGGMSERTTPQGTFRGPSRHTAP